MQRLLLLLVLAVGVLNPLSAQDKWYLEVCKETQNPYPECAGVKLGAGLELVDGEISVIPTTATGYTIQTEYLFYPEGMKGDVQTLPDKFQGTEWDISLVYWGNRIMTQYDGLPSFADCFECWMEGVDADGKRAVVFKTNPSWPDGVRVTVGFMFQRVRVSTSNPVTVVRVPVTLQ